MKPNTAVCLGRAGGGVLAAVPDCMRGWQPQGLRMGWRGLRFALGAGSLAGVCVSHISLGLDDLFLRVPGDRLGDPAGRMSVGTAGCVTLIGAGVGPDGPGA